LGDTLGATGATRTVLSSEYMCNKAESCTCDLVNGGRKTVKLADLVKNILDRLVPSQNGDF
jgi:hypothetical protein